MDLDKWRFDMVFLIVIYFLFVKNGQVGLFGLFFSDGFGLFKLLFGLGGEVEDLAVVIISTFHADGVAPMLCAAMAAFRKARLIQGVMRAPIVSVRAGGSHSINHNTEIIT